MAGNDTYRLRLAKCGALNFGQFGQGTSVPAPVSSCYYNSQCFCSVKDAKYLPNSFWFDFKSVGFRNIQSDVSHTAYSPMQRKQEKKRLI